MAERLVVYALKGSEYVAATLAALQSRKIKHAVKLVSIDAKKRALPSGGIMVPELTYENPAKGQRHSKFEQYCKALRSVNLVNHDQTVVDG